MGLSIPVHLIANADPDTTEGMGGLTTALALAKRGFTNIHVYETASNLGFVGAGIQLAPNMARVLENLGVWSDVAKDAVIVEETSIRGSAVQVEVSEQS